VKEEVRATALHRDLFNRAVLSGVVTVFLSRSKAITELGKIGKPNSTNPNAKRRM
jgi:hypothetical protein